MNAQPHTATRPSQRILAMGIVLVPALLALTALPAFAQTTLSGQTPGGAYYRIDVPASWNGDLVIWNHGLSMDEPAPDVDLGPLAELQLGEGFAVAASTYRQAGWAVFKTVADIRAMVNAFRAGFGEPGRIIVTGASLGGLVTAQLLEKGTLGNVTGALIWCGAVAGSRNWDAGIDLRLAYDAVCDAVPGGAIPGGAFGLPKGSAITDQQVAEAVGVCTGVDEPKSERSRAQKKRLARIVRAVGLREEFLLIDMWYVTRVMSDLVYERGKLKGKVGVGNAGVTYPDARVDAAIERVVPKAATARRLAKNYSPNGAVGGVKVVALHTDKDDLVIVENLGLYRDLVSPEQIVAAVAVEDEPSHCGFTLAEAVASWESLVVWLNTDRRQGAEDIQASCEQIAGLGAFPGPCRIDPNYQIGEFDDRVPPR